MAGLPGLPPPGFSDNLTESSPRGLPGLPPPGFADNQEETSIQELLGNPTSRGQAARLAGTGQVIKSIPFNFGDELFGGMGAGYDWLTGKGNTYDQRLEQARNLEEAASKTSPFISGAGEIAANLALPFKSLVGTKTGALKKTIQAGKEGAKLGALYGFGEGEGSFGNRAESAKDSAILGSLTGGGLTATGQGLVKTAKGLKEGARKLNLSAFGASKPRIERAFDKAPILKDEFGKSINPISEAIDSFTLAGGGKRGMSGDALLDDLAGQQNALVGTLRQELEVAQKFQKSPIIPEFSKTKEYISSLSGVEKTQAKKLADKFIKQTVDNTDGTLLSLQSEKVSLKSAIKDSAWGKDTSPLKTNILKRIRSDLRETIENEYYTLTNKSKSVVADINKEIGKRELLESMFDDLRATDEARDPLKWMVQNWKTTGGFGVPALLTGSLPAAVATSAVGGAAMTPSGRRLLSKGLGQVSGLGTKSGNLLNEAAFPITKGTLALSQRPHEQATNSKKSPIQGKVGISTYSAPQARNISLDSTTSKGGNQTKTDKVFGLLLESIRQVESAGGKYTTGPKTKYGVARGAYQVLDDTGKEYHAKLGIKQKYDPYNEKQQRVIASAILTDYINYFNGDVAKGITAYHSGIGNVAKGKLGPNGRAYLPKVTKVFERLVKNA